MPTAISFFSGAGGLDLGLLNAGFDIKLSVELEPVYCETLKLNKPDLNIQCQDITELSSKDIINLANLNTDDVISLIVGGSPCQSFSTAGKRLAFEDPRGQAMLHFVKLVEDLQPKAFILENVKGLLSASLKHRPLKERGNQFPPLEDDEKPGSALKFLLSSFSSYQIEYKILNSADYGVPQKRERVFFVGIRKDINKKFEFPIPTHSNDPKSNLPQWKTFKMATKDLNNIKHEHVNYSKERLKWMKKIPVGGGNWRDLQPLGEDVVKEAMKGAYFSGGGKVGFFRRVFLDKPTPTLLTSPSQNSTNLGHPIDDRPLSIQEYLAIQQFPDNFKVAGTLNQKYTQIGNAVPVGLAEILANKLYHDIID